MTVKAMDQLVNLEGSARSGFGSAGSRPSGVLDIFFWPRRVSTPLSRRITEGSVITVGNYRVRLTVGQS